jgi:hypothetical protein
VPHKFQIEKLLFDYNRFAGKFPKVVLKLPQLNFKDLRFNTDGSPLLFAHIDDRHDVPRRPCRDQEMVMALTASPYAEAVILEKIDDVGVCKLGRGITFPLVTLFCQSRGFY